MGRSAYRIWRTSSLVYWPVIVACALRQVLAACDPLQALAKKHEEAGGRWEAKHHGTLCAPQLWSLCEWDVRCPDARPLGSPSHNSWRSKPSSKQRGATFQWVGSGITQHCDCTWGDKCGDIGLQSKKQVSQVLVLFHLSSAWGSRALSWKLAISKRWSWPWGLGDSALWTLHPLELHCSKHLESRIWRGGGSCLVRNLGVLSQVRSRAYWRQHLHAWLTRLSRFWSWAIPLCHFNGQRNCFILVATWSIS